MPRENRAKQFMPFAALRGLAEALREAERETVPRAELCEEEAEALNCKLLRLQRGQTVSVVWHREGAYAAVSGAVSRLDMERRVMEVAGERICFDELREVEICEAPQG